MLMEGSYTKPRRKLNTLTAAHTITAALKALRRIKKQIERRQAIDLEKSAVFSIKNKQKYKDCNCKMVEEKNV